MDKKGDIDLVTDVDLECERMCRDLLADRFPDHGVLAEEFGDSRTEKRSRYCWVFDPLDGTTNYAHGLPIFCASLGLDIDGRAAVAARPPLPSACVTRALGSIHPHCPIVSPPRIS